MQVVNRSALVAYSAQQMFDLVADIPRYSEFLNWCSSAEILSQADEIVTASIAIDFKGLRRTFTTRNRNQAPVLIDMQLIDGPFRHLEGSWRFQPLDVDASKIELMLRFDFSNRVLQRAVGPVFTQIANQQVDAFHRRAQQVYG